MMESITQITSKTEDVEVRTLEGKSMMVAIPIWNPRIVYLSLMAVGGALPEIFLSFMSQFSDKSGQDTFALSTPNSLGTIALAGSAAFNLFVVTGFAIISANSAKRMHRFNTFLLIGIFSIFAYLWVYIVVVQISPGYIDIGEAFFTLLFFPLLLFFGYVVEKCNPIKRDFNEELEYNRRLMCK
jgi:solute carrier family 8 (sodium/calcium exchanger)